MYLLHTQGRSEEWPHIFEGAFPMSSFSTLPMKYQRMYELICFTCRPTDTNAIQPVETRMQSQLLVVRITKKKNESMCCKTPPPSFHDLTRSYCIHRFCTSIVAQDTSGRLYHGRNLDYPHDILRNVTIDVLFLKNGTVCYTWLHSSTFTSAVSLL